MGRHRAAIDGAKGRDRSKNPEGGDGDEHPEHDCCADRPDDLGRARFAQCGAALESDREQEVDRGGLVDRIGQSQVGAKQCGEDAEDEGEHGHRKEVAEGE